MRQAGARDEEDAFEVRGEQFVPVAVGCVLEWDGGGVYACAVEDVVDCAEVGEGVCDEGFYVWGLAYVDGLGVGLGGGGCG